MGWSTFINRVQKSNCRVAQGFQLWVQPLSYHGAPSLKSLLGLLYHLVQLRLSHPPSYLVELESSTTAVAFAHITRCYCTGGIYEPTFNFFCLFFFGLNLRKSIAKVTQNTTNPGEPMHLEWNSRMHITLSMTLQSI